MNGKAFLVEKLKISESLQKMLINRKNKQKRRVGKTKSRNFANTKLIQVRLPC